MKNYYHFHHRNENANDINNNTLKIESVNV